MAARHSDQEVELALHQFVQHVVGGVAAVEDQDIPRLQGVEVLQEELALAARKGRDPDLQRDPAADVDQRAHRGLRGVPTFGSPETSLQLITTLQIELRAVDGEQSQAVPPALLRKRVFEQRRHSAKNRQQKCRRYLRSRLTEGGGGDRIGGRKINALELAMRPKAIHQVTVSATIPIARHEQEERDQQLPRQHAFARMIARVDSEHRVINIFQY